MGETNSIKVTCSCGKSVKAPASAAGKRARCPACGGVLTIPGGNAVTARPLQSAAAPSSARRPAAVAATARPVNRAQQSAVATADPLDALDELARMEEAAAPLEDVARCGNCTSPMPPGAVLCTHCGFDTRTGKKLTIASAATPPKPAKAVAKGKPVVDHMAPQGSFVAGLVVSLVLAVAASSVWIGVSYATGRSFAFIAILIGAAAGVGMQIGHKGYSREGGIASAALTLVAIFLAKWVVLQMLLSRAHLHKSISDLDPAKVGYYFFSPIGMIIILIGMAAAFRTANGSITD